MATDFWASSHYKRWIFDRATLSQARAEDLLHVEDPEHLDFLAIFFANLIAKLGKRLQLKQRVIATATVFLRRFYVKNSYCEIDPFIVIATCCYVAAKAEESPVHIKTVLSEARTVFNQEGYNLKSFPNENSRLAEMEFYLVDDLECDLTVFHPYRTLMALCSKDPVNPASEDGELGVGIVEGSRYWGTGEGKLILREDGALQMAWFIINDTYRSELCLLYPPHIIAIAAIYLTLVLNEKTRATLNLQPSYSMPSNSSSLQSALTSTTTPSYQSPAAAPSRRSSRQTSKHPPSVASAQDPIEFLAGLNVSMPLVATCAQEIISLYALLDRYSEDAPASSSFSPTAHTAMRDLSGGADGGVQGIVTPAMLMAILTRMRELKIQDMHSGDKKASAVADLLEKV
ncbi:cyclin-like protein [Punctularia strigosozonata HHB-11173 SS5]|uniref:Cyclin-like protein n=1 Tax=Punctularia strigosozonata (strain HHB-11173) TaxID=741275 RepID=R7S3E7_PUNST|nr:cyclin-like protein [Punctularia strigosozonata HHB-11173 SS5]EIN04317.1 cyclin-like protein [Punctularia strigosozonata HHB-11173 SS5]